MRERDKALVDKVAKYYLQYKGVISLDDLFNLFEESKEIEVNPSTLSYIYLYILYVTTREVVNSALIAKDSKLTYREFAVDFSQESYGSLNIGLTIPVYSANLVAYFTYTEGYNAPEYSILGYLLRRIYSIIKLKKEEYSVRPEIKFFDFLPAFDKYLSILERLKEEFPEGYYRDPVYTDPEWLLKVFKAYFLLKGLEEVRLGFRGEANERVIELIKWRLYELYTFYLVARFLESKGYTIKREKRRYVAVKGDKTLELIFNSTLPSSRLKRVDDLSEIGKYEGRPDISIKGRGKPIIFECKYSGNVGYITMGRFKVMAYTYEYDPLVSVLVYPGIEDYYPYDEEDEATRSLDMEVKKRGGLLDFEYNGHKIYMMILDPKDKDEENLNKISKILSPYI